ncbi:MAG: ribonuclease Z [Bacteroidota bacterium]|nr:ribonuclease Z [Rhodothermia bacterium]MCS7155626.1 ribonuclease Z [Bacteroidota bacterium]MDW8137234.1 ribonuclease Z [Bacteroidota bacterium]MDW8284896.1 ribonuclease Z [Bacteroidota bacterium]
MGTHIIPLGTGSAIPTSKRHLSAFALVRDGQILLFDCGEGTQMRLLKAGLKRSRVQHVFISHLHGDHFYGLIGLISSLELMQRREPLYVYGPKGLKGYLEYMFALSDLRPGYELVVREVDPEGFEHAVLLETEEYFVEARPLAHRIFCMGFRFQEKPRPGKVNAERARELGITEDWQFKALKAGKPVSVSEGLLIRPEEVVGPPRPGVSFAYVTDTRFCPGAIMLAIDADVLYHEATFDHALQEKAEQTGHATALEAAQVAATAGVGLLLLGHFSARYTDVASLVEEARTVFPNTRAAEELKPIELKARRSAARGPHEGIRRA